VDIPTPRGTPIFAIASGTVMIAGVDASYEDPLIQIRHRRPGYNTCAAGGGCYYTNYMHINAATIPAGITVGATVTKGQLIAYSDASASNFEHLHFELRNAPASDPNSAWQRDAIHPLQVLKYNDHGARKIVLTIESVNDSNPALPQVTVSAALPPQGELDLVGVKVEIYERQPNGTYVLVPQPGNTADAHGYNVEPAWHDMQVFNFQYSHKDSANYPWSSFSTCPYASAHGASYEANIHLDAQDPFNASAGLFNGIKVSPGVFNASSSEYRVVYEFLELVGVASRANLCIKAMAKDVLGNVTPKISWNCP